MSQDNFNLKKFLVENKLTYNSRLTEEEDPLKDSLIKYIMSKLKVDRAKAEEYYKDITKSEDEKAAEKAAEKDVKDPFSPNYKPNDINPDFDQKEIEEKFKEHLEELKWGYFKRGKWAEVLRVDLNEKLYDAGLQNEEVLRLINDPEARAKIKAPFRETYEKDCIELFFEFIDAEVEQVLEWDDEEEKGEGPETPQVNEDIDDIIDIAKYLLNHIEEGVKHDITSFPIEYMNKERFERLYDNIFVKLAKEDKYLLERMFGISGMHFMHTLLAKYKLNELRQRNS